MPGDRKPSKRKSRPVRERIEYASDALGWLHEQLEPAPQQPPPGGGYPPAPGQPPGGGYPPAPGAGRLLGARLAEQD